VDAELSSVHSELTLNYVEPTMQAHDALLLPGAVVWVTGAVEYDELSEQQVSLREKVFYPPAWGLVSGGMPVLLHGQSRCDV
jgi:hypothetical protein